MFNSWHWKGPLIFYIFVKRQWALTTFMSITHRYFSYHCPASPWICFRIHGTSGVLGSDHCQRVFSPKPASLGSRETIMMSHENCLRGRHLGDQFSFFLFFLIIQHAIKCPTLLDIWSMARHRAEWNKI